MDHQKLFSTHLFVFDNFLDGVQYKADVEDMGTSEKFHFNEAYLLHGFGFEKFSICVVSSES